MSSTPMQANDINAIKIQEVARRPKGSKISFQKPIINEIARRPRGSKISFQKPIINEVARRPKGSKISFQKSDHK